MENKDHHIKGFTIVELMIAMAVFGLFLSIVYTSFSTVTESSKILTTRTDLLNNAQSALFILENDINSLFIINKPEYKKPDYNDEDPFGVYASYEYVNGKEFSKLRFASFNHLPLGKSKFRKISVIEYFVEFDDQKGYILKRKDNPNYKDEDFTSSVKALSVIEGIESFDVVFNYKGKKENNWNSQSSEFGYSTPEKTEIRISLKLNDSIQFFQTSIIIPVHREPVL